MSGLRKFVIFLLVLVLTIPAVFVGLMYSKLKAMNVDGNFSMLASQNYKYDNAITNILLVGSDARPGEEVSRSDSMMILTVDTKNNKLKLTSLGRDTYVAIKGHGYEKLTHAYAYGKEELLINTIEQNFKLDIQNYAKVDFYSFIDIINALDGVEVTVTEEEIGELNKFIPECHKWYKKNRDNKIQYVKTAGKHHLLGYQALAFARIRHNDGTMQRDDRQRQVIEAIMQKVKSTSITRYPALLDAVKPYVKTNMNPKDILYLGMDILKVGDLKLDTMQFPLHPENEVRLPASGYVIPFEQYEVKLLHSYIFDNVKPTADTIKKATQEWKKSGETTQYINDPEYMSNVGY